MRCRLFAVAVAALGILGMEATGLAFDAPFVAGFDRFLSRSNDDDTGGRLLIQELSCSACHAVPSAELPAKRGPSLKAAGLRLQQDWLTKFLDAPHKVKPGTTMPAMLNGLPRPEKRLAIEALVAFLATQREAFPELKSTAGNPIAPEFWNKGDVARGEKLYHQVGCVACHEPDPDYDVPAVPPSRLDKLLEQLDPEELKELGLDEAARPVRSVPHGDLTAKYTIKSLTYFLLDPHRARPAARMPSLKLSPDEAASLAAWLLRRQSKSASGMSASADARMIERGRNLFGKLRCARCHAVSQPVESRSSRPLAQVNLEAGKNCLVPQAIGVAAFSLSEEQRVALQLAISRWQGEADRTPNLDAKADADFQLLTFNCYACHERAGRGGVGPKRRAYFETVRHVDLGDEGRIPPPLDGVGRKLKPAWLAKVTSGTGDIRPHLRVRMPVFSNAAIASLQKAILAADRKAEKPATEHAVFGNLRGLAVHGRSLMDTGCVQCHPLRGERLPGILGTDLAGIEQRVEPDWFNEFLHNPIALKKRTRMPSFFPNGRSSRPDVLDGNVDRQIAAMWAYLRDIERQKLPGKILRGKEHNFELVPKDRPIVLRTFMKDAGTHAIAVGFPQKVHLSFDANAVRFAQLWKGRFLDAHGTWYDRFTPLAVPLGNDITRLPAGVPLAWLKEPDAKWPTATGEAAGYRFKGYRLDRNGVPEFLYQFAGIDVADRVMPAGDNEFVRRLTLTIGPNLEPVVAGTLWMRVLTGKELRSGNNGQETNDLGLSVLLPAELAGAALKQRRAGLAELLVPAKPGSGKPVVIEVRYQW